MGIGMGIGSGAVVTLFGRSEATSKGDSASPALENQRVEGINIDGE